MVEPLAAFAGRRFYKMSGSGNDFVFFDVRGCDDSVALGSPEVVRALCARGTGVGADGVVLLDEAGEGRVGIAYFNSDGTRADLCGNATLCTTRLASTLGLAKPGGFTIETDAGAITAQIASAEPQIDIGRVTGLLPELADVVLARGEHRVGYAVVGVPHVVVLVDSLALVDVDGRGAELRAPAPGRPQGANVNFVARDGDDWAVRTFERGVEGETLACGTGAVATAAVLTDWFALAAKRASAEVRLRTRSGRVLTALVPADRASAATLRGEGRLVFAGELG